MTATPRPAPNAPLASLRRRLSKLKRRLLPAAGAGLRRKQGERAAAVVARALEQAGDGERIPIALHAYTVGRLEHFHHYLGAVFLPVASYVDTGAITAGDLCLAPESGPMNRILEEFCGSLGIDTTFYPPGLSAALAERDDLRQLHLPPTDACNDSDFLLRPHQVERVRRVGFAFAGITDTPTGAPPDILLIDRAPPPSYYTSAAYAYTEKNPDGIAGSDRRSVANMADFEARLSGLGSLRLAVLEDMPFREQIRAFHGPRVIVAQHGAALDGLVWAHPGTAVVEIVPVNVYGNRYTYYSNIARGMGQRHDHVMQGHPHGPVDCEVIASLVAQALAR